MGITTGFRAFGTAEVIKSRLAIDYVCHLCASARTDVKLHTAECE